jgi:uncharacterized membrane protein (DUF373 family)
MSAGPNDIAPVSRGVRVVLERLVRLCELVVVASAELLLAGAILMATVVLYGLFIERLPATLGSVSSLEEVQDEIEHVFAGVLLLLLGLELLKSLSSFFIGYRVQVEIIIVVAIIAVTRHVLLVDIERTEALKLIAIAGLVLALALSYAIVRRSGAGKPSPGADG